MAAARGSEGTSAGAVAVLTAGIGVLAPEGFAEAEAEAEEEVVVVGEERRSEMACLARLFVLVRRSASWEGEKDHCLNCEDVRYLSSSVAITAMPSACEPWARSQQVLVVSVKEARVQYSVQNGTLGSHYLFSSTAVCRT